MGGTVEYTVKAKGRQPGVVRLELDGQAHDQEVKLRRQGRKKRTKPRRGKSRATGRKTRQPAGALPVKTRVLR